MTGHRRTRVRSKVLAGRTSSTTCAQGCRRQRRLALFPGSLRDDFVLANRWRMAKNKMPELLKTGEKSFCRSRAGKRAGESDCSFPPSLPLAQAPSGGQGWVGNCAPPSPRSRNCMPAKPVVNTGIQPSSPLAHSLIKLYGFALFPETSTPVSNNWRPTKLML